MITVRINATNIIQLLSSSMSIYNSEIGDFSATFLYSSLSNLTVDNCSFHDSYNENQNSKSSEIIVLYLENFNSFKITNNQFHTLANDATGPVNSLLMLIIYLKKRRLL